MQGSEPVQGTKMKTRNEILTGTVPEIPNRIKNFK